MKITCQNKECGTTINIPDDKVPAKPVKIACPKCKSPNILTPAKTSTDVTPEKEPPKQGGNVEQNIMNKVEQRLASFRNELLGQLQQGVSLPTQGAHIGTGTGLIPQSGGEVPKKALICDDDKMIRKVINDCVTELGYETDEAGSIDEALKVLDHPELDYNLILIDKVFPDDDEGGYKILSKIATLQIDSRRKIFVVFISGDIKSGDPSAAFLSGANIMLNKQDLGKLSTILENEMADYEKLYKVFKNCLEMTKTVKS